MYGSGGPPGLIAFPAVESGARAEQWPAERQDDAARILVEMEEQDQGRYQLTDAQVAEVERRMSNSDGKVMSAAEVRARLSQRGV